MGDLTKFVAPEAVQEMQAILHAAREHAKEQRGKSGGGGGKKPKPNQKSQKAEARARAEKLLRRLLLVIDEHGGVLDCAQEGGACLLLNIASSTDRLCENVCLRIVPCPLRLKVDVRAVAELFQGPAVSMLMAGSICEDWPLGA